MRWSKSWISSCVGYQVALNFANAVIVKLVEANPGRRDHRPPRWHTRPFIVFFVELTKVRLILVPQYSPTFTARDLSWEFSELPYQCDTPSCWRMRYFLSTFMKSTILRTFLSSSFARFKVSDRHTTGQRQLENTYNFMLTATKRRLNGGEVLEFTWNDGIKMKDVFADPQRVDAPLDRIWSCITSDLTDFLESYHSYRGDADLKVGDWENLEKSDGECSCQRQLDVTVTLPSLARMIPGIPAKTHLVEFHHARRSQKSIELRICSATPDVPYGTYFRIQALISFTELRNSQVCDVSIKIGINFLHHPFLIKKALKKRVANSAREGYEEWFGMARQIFTSGTSTVLEEYKSRCKAEAEAAEADGGVFGKEAEAALLAARLYLPDDDDDSSS